MIVNFPSASVDARAAVARRFLVEGNEPAVLADVYDQDINISVWKRALPAKLKAEVAALLASSRNIELSMTLSPANAEGRISAALGAESESPLCEDIAQVTRMFCDLFDLRAVGLRLATLSSAMCPRFHVDLVPCRLLTTYAGVATEWLPHDTVDRSKLGPGNNGQPDAESGLYAHDGQIRQLECGHVALLKGESWVGNECAGLVHRSPTVPEGSRRLLLTLDFAR